MPAVTGDVAEADDVSLLTPAEAAAAAGAKPETKPSDPPGNQSTNASEVDALLVRLDELEARVAASDTSSEVRSRTVEFAGKALATILASALSSLLDRTLVSLWDEELVIRIVYTVLASLLMPPLAWALSGEVTHGQTATKDALKLIAKASPMILAWAWKDLVSQLCTDTKEHKWVAYPLIALGMLLGVAAWKMLPGYEVAAKCEIQQDPGLCSRYLAMAQSLGLATGFACNQVARIWIVDLQSPAATLAAQTAYAIAATRCGVHPSPSVVLTLCVSAAWLRGGLLSTETSRRQEKSSRQAANSTRHCDQPSLAPWGLCLRGPSVTR